MQADNRLLTNLIKCEKEHHSALLGFLVRSHTSLAALSAYASTASPPVAHALRGCIQSFAAADEGLRGYAAALEGWKEELKEVKRVEDELKSVVKDKDILVNRLIKASKQKIPTSSIQAGPAPIPTASSPSSSSLSFSQPTSQPYSYTPTPHATQHINSKLAQAQRELQACEAHLASKEAELTEVRRSAIAEGMARRCRAMADAGHVWRERGEMGLGALGELTGEDAGAPPNQYHNAHRRTLSQSTSSSLAPSHSVSQHRRSQSPFSPTYSHSRSASPGPGTYHSISGGGYQHSHPLPALPERNSWHVEDSYQDAPRRPDPPRRPVSLIDPPRAPALHRRPVSSNELPALPDEVTFDIPPPHSIGHETGDIIPLGRPVSSIGHAGDRWEDSSSEEEGNYQVVENDASAGARWEDEVDPEILRAVENMGLAVPPRPKKVVNEMPRNTPPTPPDTVSSSSPVRLPDLRVIEATPQKGKAKGKGKKARRPRGDTVGQSRDEAQREQGDGPTSEIVEKALPEPVLAPIPRAPSPVVVSRSPSPAPAPMVPRATPSPAPRVLSPAPDDPTPLRLASPVLAPTPTLTAPAPQPAHAPFATQPRPISPCSDSRGDRDDVIMDKSNRAPSPSSPSPEVETHPPSPIFETPHTTAAFGPLRPVEAHTGEFPIELESVVDPATVAVVDYEPPSTVFSTPRASLTVFDTPRAPSTVFETPRAAPSVFDTPKAVPSVVHSPSAHTESVYETPLVIPSDIPRVPRSETPRLEQLEVPSSPDMPLRKAPKSPRLEISQPQLEIPKPQPETPKLQLETPKSPPPETPKLPPTGLITPMATGSTPNPPAQDRPKPKRRVVSGDDTLGRKKVTKKKGRQSSMGEPRTAEERAELADRLRDSDTTAPHVRFPPPNGMFVPSAPPPRPKPGALYLPSSGTTRSDVGPARGHHFDVPPSPGGTSAGRNRSGSVNGSTSFFGRVAGLFGRKKQSDGYISSGGQAWRTRTDGNIARGRGDDSSEEEQPRNLVTVTNVNPRLVSVDNNPPGSPKPGGLGRKLTKAEKGQTLRVGPPESPSRTRKPSITEEQIVPAKSKKSKSRSVDGGVSRKGSLRSNASDPHGRANSDVGRKAGKEPTSLMSIVEGPGLVLPSQFVTRRTDSPGPRSESPVRAQTLAVPPARAVSPTSTAAPRPVRATSPMPLKSALRNRTPSPLPPTTDVPAPQPNLSVPPSNIPAQSPRNSIAESIYETGEEDFDSATDGEDDRSDHTAGGPSQTITVVPAPAPPAHSPGAALAAFKDNLQTSNSAAGSVSTAGPRSANSAQRKSVRINPAPPQMSATPTATPGSELEEEPSWTRQDDKPSSSSGGWASRIGRGWEDSSDESVDEEYERVRNALATSSKHIEAMNKPIHTRR